MEMKTIELASDVIAGSTTFAGLIIVYVGAVAASFGGFEKEAKGAVAPRLRRRARNAAIGVCLAAIAAALAILGKWASSNLLVELSIFLFIITLAWGVAVTFETVREIK